VIRVPNSISHTEVKESIKTYITHNKGASWDIIRAPRHTHRGDSTDCYKDEGCSLHLELYANRGVFSPVYSQESAIGVVIGTGNIGSKLSENSSDKNMYISRDGGLIWKTAKTGNYIYDIGDHGAIILAAKVKEATSHIEFSWDFGNTWEKM
jgi:hypothetical protein